jgi:hypothetical protein
MTLDTHAQESTAAGICRCVRENARLLLAIGLSAIALTGAITTIILTV